MSLSESISDKYLVLIDDAQSAAIVLRKLLAAVGVRVIAFSSRTDCADFVACDESRNGPIAFIVDLVLDASIDSGLLVIRECRRRFPTVPVLVWSKEVSDDNQISERAKKHGASAVFEKYFDDDKLLNMVHELIRATDCTKHGDTRQCPS